MAKIEFSSADAPLRRIGEVVNDDLRARLAEGELESQSRMHHLGVDGRLQMFEVVAPPDARFNPHSHDEDEIILVVEGELHAGSQVVRAGESMYVTGGTVYSFRAGSHGLRFFNFRPRMDTTFRTVAETRAAED